MDTWIVVSKQFDFTRKSKGPVSVAKNSEFIEEFGHNHRIWTSIAISGLDDALFDQNGVIKSHPFDQQWRVEVHPRWSLWIDTSFWSFVGSSSGDQGESTCR